MCDDFWDLNDATVVCRQLGYLRAIFAYHTSQFGQGTGPIWLDDIHCTGTETRLDQCPHNGIGVHNCIHFEDAGVACTSKNMYICTVYCIEKLNFIMCVHTYALCKLYNLQIYLSIKSDWLMVPMNILAVLKYTLIVLVALTMLNGVQYVMISGAFWMPE